MPAKEKKSKNQIRRERAKLKKQQQLAVGSSTPDESTGSKDPNKETSDASQQHQQHHAPSKLLQSLELEPTDIPEEYRNILNKFALDETVSRAGDGDERIMFSDDEDEDDHEDLENEHNESSNNHHHQNKNSGDTLNVSIGDTANGNTKTSKRQLRKSNKMSLAELKAQAPRPEVVEWYDADAPNPLLLVQIKSTPGVVPVPDHWQYKREYLSSKRGSRKAPFDLPDYIKETGIMEMRDALKDDDRTLQQKTRERVQPKMGKMDLDYQKLHDAFFKFQTRPRLYGFADLYHENKDLEVDFSEFRPGKLSDRLKDALNIPPGAPPPWLLMMQRYGPPPSYPGLKIPGLNAPIPPGAQWGFHPGGYGRPPLDENGKPLYGDVYGDSNDMSKSGQVSKRLDGGKLGEEIKKLTWGQMIDDYGEEDEDEQDDDEDGDENAGQGEDYDMDYDEGAGYVDEDAANAAAARAQDSLDLRKAKRQKVEDLSGNEYDDDADVAEDIPDDERPAVVESAPAYQVLEQRSESGGFLGTQKVYEIPKDGVPSDIMSTVDQLLAEGAKSAKK